MANHPAPAPDPVPGPADGGRSHYDRMLAGELYLADDPRIVDEQAEAHRLMEAFNSTPAGDRAGRDGLLRRLLGSLGDGAVVRAPLYCDFGSHLAIGDRTFVNFGLVALDVARVTIGADCQLGPNVQLLTPIHPLDAGLRRTGGSRPRPSPSETTCGSGAGSPSSRG